VTRGALAEYTRSEALDVETALHLYTAGSAMVLGEAGAGCLEPRSWALRFAAPLSDRLRPPLRLDDSFTRGTIEVKRWDEESHGWDERCEWRGRTRLCLGVFMRSLGVFDVSIAGYAGLVLAATGRRC